MKKILIVDDEVHITNALKRELSDWSDQRQIGILTSNNPLEVEEIIKTEKDIFLLLTDMMMPGKSGADLSKSVKDLNEQIMIIIMTGYSHIDFVVKAVSTGISSLIIKPWNLDLLIIELENALENFNLREQELIYKKLIEEEMKWGGELQKQLLKREIPNNKNVSFSVHYEPLPSLHCGGDYYDIIPLCDNRFLVICADVAGHGIKAAFITTILKSIIFSQYVSENEKNLSPAHFLKWLNFKLLAELSSCPDIIITASVVLIDLNNKQVIYSNGGHTPLYVFHKNRIHEIVNPAPALNFSNDVKYKDVKIQLNYGDKIYFLTDGLIETGLDNNTISKDEVFRLIESSAIGNSTAESLVEIFREYSLTGSFSDDVTAIIVELIL